MWHDFVQESEGCGSGIPLSEAKNSIKKVGEFFAQNQSCQVVCTNGRCLACSPRTAVLVGYSPVYLLCLQTPFQLSILVHNAQGCVPAFHISPLGTPFVPTRRSLFGQRPSSLELQLSRTSHAGA